MEHVSIDEVEPQSIGDDVDRRGLSDPLGTADVSVNHYRLDPGERFSSGLHTHMDQEEVFVVVEGEATFETAESAGEEMDVEEVTVSAGEAVRFAPGEYQSGHNDGDEPLRAIALGAPRDSRDVRIPQSCPDCGNENVRAMPAEDGEGFDLVCPACDTELQA